VTLRTEFRAAHWALLGPDVDLRHTEYDLDEASRCDRSTDYPVAERGRGRFDRDRRRQPRQRLRLLAQTAQPPRRSQALHLAAGDGYGGADAAREWYRWAKKPKRLEIFSGDRHGTDMLRPGEPTAQPLTRLVLNFLLQVLPPQKR